MGTEKLIAVNFLQDKLSEIHDKKIFEDLLQKMFTIDVSDIMIEFAKLHVKAALKAAFEDAPCGSSTDIVTCEELHEAIINSYPLENIQ